MRQTPSVERDQAIYIHVATCADPRMPETTRSLMLGLNFMPGQWGYIGWPGYCGNPTLLVTCKALFCK